MTPLDPSNAHYKYLKRELHFPLLWKNFDLPMTLTFFDNLQKLSKRKIQEQKFPPLPGITPWCEVKKDNYLCTWATLRHSRRFTYNGACTCHTAACGRIKQSTWRSTGVSCLWKHFESGKLHIELEKTPIGRTFYRTRENLTLENFYIELEKTHIPDSFIQYSVQCKITSWANWGGEGCWLDEWGHSEPTPTSAPWRMDDKWSGNSFLLVTMVVS